MDVSQVSEYDLVSVSTVTSLHFHSAIMFADAGGSDQSTRVRVRSICICVSVCRHRPLDQSTRVRGGDQSTRVREIYHVYVSVYAETDPWIPTQKSCAHQGNTRGETDPCGNGITGANKVLLSAQCPLVLISSQCSRHVERQTGVVIGGAGAREHCELIVRHVQMLQGRPVRLCVFVRCVHTCMGVDPI